MKVHYGASIPPGLTAPTRGELLIRVERLILQDELIAPLQPAGAPLIPIDHCAIQFAFWGMDAATNSSSSSSSPSSSSSSSTHLATCVPATDAHTDRGVQRVVFPVKTLEPQLVQYFQHMHNSAFRGVQLRVTVPPQFSGKKVHIPVGIAIVNVSGVTATSPIQGWFHVMHHEKENECIGRVKVSISLNMFATPRAAAEEEQRTAKPKLSNPVDATSHLTTTAEEATLEMVTIESTANSNKHHTIDVIGSSSSNNTTSAVAPAARHVTFARPAAAAPPQQSSAALSDVSHKDNLQSITTAQYSSSSNVTNFHANPHSLFSEVEAHQQQRGQQHREQHATTSSSTIVSGSSGDAQIRSWFERGVALRNRMTQACSGGSIGSNDIIARSSLPSLTFETFSSSSAIPLRAVPQISGAEHLLVAQGGMMRAGVGGGDLNDSTTTTTSSSSSDDDEKVGLDDVSVSSDSDAQQHHPRRPTTKASASGGPAPATACAAVATTSIACDSTLELSLRNIGFASGPIPRPEVPPQYRHVASSLLPQLPHHLCELRFALRWSRDVVLADPTLLSASDATERDASSVAGLSSFVHVLPFPPGQEDRCITLHVPRVLSYTTQSKLVLECVHVISAEAPLRDRFPVSSISTAAGGGELSFDVDRMHREHLQAQHDQNRSSVHRVVIAEVVVGVCVIDLCARTEKRCGFHDPLTGSTHVWADCSLELRPTTSTMAYYNNHHHPNNNNIHAFTTGPGEEVAFAADSYLDERVTTVKGNTFKHFDPTKKKKKKKKKQRNALSKHRPRGHYHQSTSGDEDSYDSSSDSNASLNSSSSCTGTTDDSTDHIATHRRHHREEGAAPRVVIYTSPSSHEKTGATTTTETTVTIRHEPTQQRSSFTSASLVLTPPHSNATAGAGGSSSVPPCTRFHLSILEAKGLPLVCAQLQHGVELDIAQDSSYCPPRTFVNLEDILELRKSKLASSTAAVLPNVDLLCSTHPRALPIRESWYVEAAVQGEGTRSHPQAQGSTAPRFAFECIVALPTTTTTTDHSGGGGSHSVSPLPLCELAGSLEIGLYHVADTLDLSRHEGNRQQQESEEAAEQRLWNASRPMGRVVVDLSPLRYLTHTDGWHRVVSTGDVLETVIGFVRVGVRTL
ncbi:Hypothetical protein, putative [Bodo saltans]|uniref:C2CD3 N-terminal C2 domain-containing protein n=1 Tax=Bodo saltans TaxID=75058 RepID=A0A0S4J3U6_BODSA|nr:Hypothetical protein, putative [Bodo saltans]|eukprot:CUG80088.1 Hypothetical protein, putative [Bodo saltans]